MAGLRGSLHVYGMAEPDAVNRLNAALEGRYRIEQKLGEGGMAAVYLTEDIRHGRKVALKVLKPELAAVVGADRFLTEIMTTANLQHPHILPLHDSGEADGLLFYVMPFVKGESLRERLDREHQLPLDDAVRIITSMAEALDYAHRQGVIHRDIKPDNVLLQDGKPVISDFGIALAVGAAGGDRLTETGLSLGTPHYMSPEQATGDQHVGPATDIYALGCVLYEMLIGEPPFSGSSPRAVLGKIIIGEVPSAQAERESVPPNVDAVIAKSLAKVPADRFRTLAEFRNALATPSFRYGAAPPEEGSVTLWKRAAIVTAAAALAAVAGWAFEAAGPDPVPQAVERYELTFPEGQAPTPRLGSDLSGAAEDLVGNLTLALSPDGSRLAYVRMESDGSRHIWVRSWDQESAVRIPGTEGARSPFFSPNGTSIGFLTSRPATGIRVVEGEGGPPLSLVEADASDDAGATWAPDGDIYYIGRSSSLRRIPAVGGDAETVLEPDRAEGVAGLGFPEALPRGSGLLVTLQRGGGPRVGMESDSVAVLDLDTGELRTLVRGLRAVYLPEGYLIVVTVEGELTAVPFDERRLEVTGPGIPILSGLGAPTRGRIVNMALSYSGRLVYSEDRGGPSEVIWVDRAGRSVSAEPGWTIDDLVVMALSPNGRRILIVREGQELWMKELGGSFVQLPMKGGIPWWSPDGSEVIYSSDASGTLSYDLWSGSPDGSRAPRLLLDLDRPLAYGAREPGGASLLVRTAVAPTTAQLLRVSEDGSVVDTLLTSESFSYTSPALSPDGRFLAYVAIGSGRSEVHVRTYPAMDRTWPVSVRGGREPVWSPDGRRIYYKSLPDAAESRPAELVSVAFDPTEDVLERIPLFALPEGVSNSVLFSLFDVDRNDERFLMIRTLEPSEEGTSYHVVSGFLEEVRARLGR